jgi:hypothetical protein
LDRISLVRACLAPARLARAPVRISCHRFSAARESMGCQRATVLPNEHGVDMWLPRQQSCATVRPHHEQSRGQRVRLGGGRGQ